MLEGTAGDADLGRGVALCVCVVDSEPGLSACEAGVRLGSPLHWCSSIVSRLDVVLCLGQRFRLAVVRSSFA